MFHAGTRLNAQGEVETCGGRVLCATALGEDIAEAQRNAYRLADGLSWEGGFCRRDIGYRALQR